MQQLRDELDKVKGPGAAAQSAAGGGAEGVRRRCGEGFLLLLPTPYSLLATCYLLLATSYSPLLTWKLVW